MATRREANDVAAAAAALVAVALLPRGTLALGVLAFGLAGLGCSALLPLTIGFGQEELVAMSTSVAGGVIAFYQLGYGVAAFGAGPLQDAGVGLAAIFPVHRGGGGGPGGPVVRADRPTDRTVPC